MTTTENDPGRAQLEQQWREDRLAAFDRTIPPRFAAAVELPPAVTGWLDAAAADAPTNLLLLGPIGTGKTHLAWHVARHYLDRVPATAVVFTATELAHLVRGDQADTTIARLQAVSVLVLDDMGASALTPWVDDALFAIIDHRYRWLRPTVITSNEANLRDALGERIASRLAQGAVVVPMKGADRRRRA